MEEVFKDLPAISEEVIKEIKSHFANYLFLKVIERGKKEFVCTACGAKFKRGAKIKLRTETPNDRELSLAKHKDTCTCPMCGVTSEVVNIKRRKTDGMYQSKWYVVFLPANAEKVFVRGIRYMRDFSSSLKGEWSLRECQRYVLEPGKAEMYENIYSDGLWYKKKIIIDAFTWNHGLWCEKYAYEIIACDGAGNIRYGTDEEQFDGTFLKYNSYTRYDGRIYNTPYMKYIGWYARHPQIEMLVKMGRFEIVDRMILDNTDNKQVFDWSAKTIWDLCRLPKNLYNYMMSISKYYEWIPILKTYRMLGGKKEKDFDFAKKLNDIFKNNYTSWTAYGYTVGSRKHINEYIRICKKVKKHPKDVLNYLKKYQEENRGKCHLCVGPSFTEIYDMWLDYISMSIDAEERAAGKHLKEYQFNPTPKALKEEHDKFIKKKQKEEAARKRAEALEYAKNREKQMKREAATLEKKYPKVPVNLAKVKDVFEYENEKYKIIVPTGIYDILLEGDALSHCVGTSQRYYDRIEHNESYIAFLRLSSKPDEPWYTLEVEPGGTVRQKRTYNDTQDAGLTAAAPFIQEWQEAVSQRLSKKQREYAKKARKKYAEEQAELRANGVKVHYGKYAGKLLADILENDLIINEREAVTA